MTHEEAYQIDNALVGLFLDAYGAQLVARLGGRDEFLRLMLGRHKHAGVMGVMGEAMCAVRVTIEFDARPEAVARALTGDTDAPRG